MQVSKAFNFTFIVQPCDCFCADVCMHVCVCMCVYACVYASVYPSPKLLITSGVMWCAIQTPYHWSSKLCCFYMAAVVGIINGHGLSIHMHHGNQLNKDKLALYKPLLHCNNHLQLSNKVQGFSYRSVKVGVVDIVVCVLSHLKEELAWAVD